jgi:hypothetical protein
MPVTLTVPTLDEIQTAINVGALDEHLNTIAAMLRTRMKHAGSGIFAVGDRVQFNSTVRPAYLYKGLPGDPGPLAGTICKVNETTVSIDLDHGRGKFSGLRPLRQCSMSLLERIAEVGPGAVADGPDPYEDAA